MFARLFALFLLVSAAVLPGGAAAQDFSYSRHVFNPVMKPQGFDNVVVDCADNDWCQTLVIAGAAYFGIPPEQVRLAAEVIRTQQRRDGQETRNWLTPRSNQKFCRATLRYTSVAPQSGGRMPKMSIGLWSGGIGLYAHTPQQQVGGGKTWIESVVMVESVRANRWQEHLRSGRCTLPDNEAGRKVYMCGGRGCKKQDF